MLSGTSTVVAARSDEDVGDVLCMCKWRLAALTGTTMELLHGQERVSGYCTIVRDWPGVQPTGEITEYQLLVTR
eukprot:2635125-Amphidinium_carterae.1